MTICNVLHGARDDRADVGRGEGFEAHSLTAAELRALGLAPAVAAVMLVLTFGDRSLPARLESAGCRS